MSVFNRWFEKLEAYIFSLMFAGIAYMCMVTFQTKFRHDELKKSVESQMAGLQASLEEQRYSLEEDFEIRLEEFSADQSAEVLKIRRSVLELAQKTGNIEDVVEILLTQRSQYRIKTPPSSPKIDNEIIRPNFDENTVFDSIANNNNNNNDSNSNSNSNSNSYDDGDATASDVDTEEKLLNLEIFAEAAEIEASKIASILTDEIEEPSDKDFAWSRIGSLSNIVSANRSELSKYLRSLYTDITVRIVDSSLMDVLQADPLVKYFAVALQSEKLDYLLQGDRPFVVFVPVDFSRLKADDDSEDNGVFSIVKRTRLSNERLLGLMSETVIPITESGVAVGTQTIDTLAGTRLKMRSRGSRVRVGRANVLWVNRANNGLVFVTDKDVVSQLPRSLPGVE